MTQQPAMVVVDDDPDIRDTLKDYFEANGFSVTEAADGQELRQCLTTDRFDLAILDLKLPGEDGLALCRFLREEYDMGIVMLTGSGDSIDRVVGLEVGADDYVSKPFELRELLARVRSVLRRVRKPDTAESGQPEQAPPAENGQFEFGPVKINSNSRILIKPDGEAMPLTSMEFDLLKAFADRPNRVLSRDVLLEAAHGRDWEPFDRSIDVRVTRLRKKVEPNPERPRFIKTVRGVGYLFDPQGK